MPDTTTTPPVNPAPATPKRLRGDHNRQFLNELKDARKVAQSAIDSRYSAGLADVEMDSTLPTQIVTLADSITTDLGLMQGARTGRKSMTKQEILARDALIAVLSPIQTAAKRKFQGADEPLRKNYGIGEPLANLGLEEVTLVCRGVLARLSPDANNTPPLDVLLGIKADTIAALATAIDTYGAKDTAQGTQQDLASGLLEKVQTNIDTLASLRRQIQLAADQAYPWRKQGVSTIRKAFLLPVDRPLTD